MKKRNPNLGTTEANKRNPNLETKEAERGAPTSKQRSLKKGNPNPRRKEAENPESQQEKKRDRLTTLNVINEADKRGIFAPNL